MGGRSSSKTATTVTNTDRRIGATEGSRVVTEGGRIREDHRTSIRVDAVDADVVRAALGEGGAVDVIDRALNGAGDVLGQALAFSSAEGDRTRAVVETAIAGEQQEFASLQSFLKSSTVLAGVAVVAVAWAATR